MDDDCFNCYYCDVCGIQLEEEKGWWVCLECDHCDVCLACYVEKKHLPHHTRCTLVAYQSSS